MFKCSFIANRDGKLAVFAAKQTSRNVVEANIKQFLRVSYAFTKLTWSNSANIISSLWRMCQYSSIRCWKKSETWTDFLSANTITPKKVKCLKCPLQLNISRGSILLTSGSQWHAYLRSFQFSMQLVCSWLEFFNFQIIWALYNGQV